MERELSRELAALTAGAAGSGAAGGAAAGDVSRGARRVRELLPALAHTLLQ